MSGYDDLYWSEVVVDDSPLERAREDADLREWEAEAEQDRLHRDDPLYRSGLFMANAALCAVLENKKAA